MLPNDTFFKFRTNDWKLFEDGAVCNPKIIQHDFLSVILLYRIFCWRFQDVCSSKRMLCSTKWHSFLCDAHHKVQTVYIFMIMKCPIYRNSLCHSTQFNAHSWMCTMHCVLCKFPTCQNQEQSSTHFHDIVCSRSAFIPLYVAYREYIVIFKSIKILY